MVASTAIAVPPLGEYPQPRARFRWREPSVLPGFGLTLGFTLTYLSLIVLLPLAALVLKSLELSWDQMWEAATSARARAAFGTTRSLVTSPRPTSSPRNRRISRSTPVAVSSACA